MPKFERKTREERKNEIRTAAIDVFMSKGYRNTTMEDIIHNTSLSKGGVYRYYSSTKDILIDIMRFGSEYRTDIFRKISEDFDKEISFHELLLKFAINKIYDDKPYMKLYIMFISEIIYDEELKKLFYEIEHESFIKMLDVIGTNFSEEEKEIFKKKNMFTSRMINAILFIDSIFEEQHIMLENKEKVVALLKSFINNNLD